MAEGNNVKLAPILLTAEPTPGLWLLCGPPASGKSTFQHFFWSGPVVSPDDLRAAMFGKEYRHRAEGLIWLRAQQQARRLLSAGKGVLIDATNVSRGARRRWIRMAEAAGTPVYAVVCWDPEGEPVDELVRRNAARERTVPEEKLREIAAARETPSRDEGLTGVWTVVADGQKAPCCAGKAAARGLWLWLASSLLPVRFGNHRVAFGNQVPGQVHGGSVLDLQRKPPKAPHIGRHGDPGLLEKHLPVLRQRLGRNRNHRSVAGREDKALPLDLVHHVVPRILLHGAIEGKAIGLQFIPER